MQKIPLKMATPGMKLAKEVVDDQGRVLCHPGTELDASLLEKFERLGVKFVTVEGHPINFPWERPLKEELSLLEKRFLRVKDDERLLMIKEVLRQYFLENRD